MALFLGCGLLGVICPIVLARLIATYSMPGFYCSLVRLLGLTIISFEMAILIKSSFKALELMDGGCPISNQRTICHCTAELFWLKVFVFML
jgi:hypothetical protein